MGVKSWRNMTILHFLLSQIRCLVKFFLIIYSQPRRKIFEPRNHLIQIRSSDTKRIIEPIRNEPCILPLTKYCWKQVVKVLDLKFDVRIRQFFPGKIKCRSDSSKFYSVPSVLSKKIRNAKKGFTFWVVVLDYCLLTWTHWLFESETRILPVEETATPWGLANSPLPRPLVPTVRIRSSSTGPPREPREVQDLEDKRRIRPAKNDTFR